jgi:hypothetical protein
MTTEPLSAFAANTLSVNCWQFGPMATIAVDGTVTIDWEKVEEMAGGDYKGGMPQSIARMLMAARERGRIDVAMHSL